LATEISLRTFRHQGFEGQGFEIMGFFQKKLGALCIDSGRFISQFQVNFSQMTDALLKY